MTHGSLFSGIGGFDLAAEWMGWENKFHCEWNEFGQKVLHYYWPNAEQFTDITKTDFTKYADSIDILTGGFPCQPYSLAGKRKGKEDERHLWPEMLRAIREIRPRWVVGENVFGLINWSGGLVFHEVQTDLEAEGYEVFPYVLPAAGVKNAPHRRDRVWFVAYCNSNGQHRGNSEYEINTSEAGEYAQRNAIKSDGNGDAADTNGTGWRKGYQEIKRKSSEQFNSDSFFENAADTSNQGLQRGTIIRGIGGIGEKSHQQPTGFLCTDWEKFPTQSPVCNGDDGLPSRLDSITFPKWRNESIKAGGNAIVPQVALQIFKAIEQYENLTKR